MPTVSANSQCQHPVTTLSANTQCQHSVPIDLICALAAASVADKVDEDVDAGSVDTSGYLNCRKLGAVDKQPAKCWP